MSGARVLLTGAFGNVGLNTLEHLLALGHEVHAFDLDTPGNRKRQLQVQGGNTSRCTIHWGDLREADVVGRVVAEARPEVVLHVAAVIAPLAYVHPALAHAVNVEGTRHLIEACQRLPTPPRVVLVSSYSVHGPRNPHRDLAPITGETALAPIDNYGRHKVWAEAALRDSGLDWTIIRLPAVMPTAPDWGRDPSFLKFFYMLPSDRREHLLDSRDAGLALAHAVEAEVAGRCFVLGGPDHDCRVLGRDYHVQSARVMGLQAIALEAFRRGDPQVDASWYCEDWVDTGPSQAALDYQRHSFADYLDFMRHQAGLSRYLLRPLSPLIRWHLSRSSPYYGQEQVADPTPMSAVICATFGLDL